MAAINGLKVCQIRSHASTVACFSLKPWGVLSSSILERPFWMRWRRVARLMAAGAHSDERTTWTILLLGKGMLGFGEANTYFKFKYSNRLSWVAQYVICHPV